MVLKLSFQAKVILVELTNDASSNMALHSLVHFVQPILSKSLELTKSKYDYRIIKWRSVLRKYQFSFFVLFFFWLLLLHFVNDNKRSINDGDFSAACMRSKIGSNLCDQLQTRLVPLFIGLKQSNRRCYCSIENFGYTRAQNLIMFESGSDVSTVFIRKFWKFSKKDWS